MAVVIDIVAVLAGLTVGIYSITKAVNGKASYLVGVAAGAITLFTGVSLLLHHIS
jgi:hypothetical protein